MTSRPNILLIFTDQQQQRLMGAYGNPLVRTPNLDALAREGVKFTNAITPQPVCTPARASLLTGTYGHMHGCVRNNAVLSPEVPTLAEMLRPCGYRCGYIGKWHIGNEIIPQRGFEEFYRSTEDGYMSRAARVERGLYSTYDRFLRERGYAPGSDKPGAFFTRPEVCRLPEEVGKPAYTAREAEAFFASLDDRPFFLAVNFLEPHPPYFSPWDGMYAKEQMTLPANYHVDEEEMAGWSRRTRAFRDFYYHDGHNIRTGAPDDLLENMARYYGLTSLADKYIGRILESLQAHGLANDTVVVFTTDHGDMMGSHQIVDKGVMFEESLKVPLLVRYPGKVLAGHESDAVVNLADVVPTLLELARVAQPASVQGRSFAGLLRGEDKGWPDYGVSEWNGALQNMHRRSPRFAEVLNAHVRCVVTRRWKLVLTPGDKSELYDLKSDPFEQRSVFDRAENRGVVRDLYARLVEWQRETADPMTALDV